MYIVFEGIVGTGKTTHSKKLYDYLRYKFPNKEVVWTREPGGTEISQKIREVVQGIKFNEEMDPTCEAYLYAASRAQALRTVVKPVLENNGVVVADRSFITSVAYQGYARGVGIKKILKINKTAIEHLVPDLVIFLDLDVKKAISRTCNIDGDKWERLGEEFFEKVREGYMKVSNLKMFKGKWVNIKLKNINTEKNFKKILKAIEPYIKNLE